MAATDAVAAAGDSPVWKEIETSETYLVLCKYEEAASLARSIIKQLRDNPVQNHPIENDFKFELKDMFESAGMVFVQAMRPLGTTQDILKELKMLFGSVIAIPPQTFVTGAQFQIVDGFTTGLQEDFEKFLNNWRFSDEGHYLPAEATGDPCLNPIVDVEDYLEIFESYVMVYLAKLGKEIDLAISWTKNGDIPEGKRQEFLEKLNSMKAPETTIQPRSLPSDSASHEGIEYGVQHNDQNSHQGASYFRWLSHFRLDMESGRHKIRLSNGNVFFGCMFLVSLLVYRSRIRRGGTLQRFVKKQVQSLKQTLVDAWQLVFSYQVNPLAAVQSLPAITHGSH